MERAVILWPSSLLPPEAMPDRMRARGAPSLPELGGDFTLAEISRTEHLQRVLARSATREEAARILGIDLSTLWRRRKKLDP